VLGWVWGGGWTPADVLTILGLVLGVWLHPSPPRRVLGPREGAARHGAGEGAPGPLPWVSVPCGHRLGAGLVAAGRERCEQPPVPLPSPAARGRPRRAISGRINRMPRSRAGHLRSSLAPPGKHSSPGEDSRHNLRGPSTPAGLDSAKRPGRG